MIFKEKIFNNKSSLIIFLGWIVYTISYLGKVNYSANITQVMDFYNITKSEAGIVPTFFFFAYGIGQVFNGILCKKYNIKWIIFGSIILSASINLTIAITTEFKIIKWLWLVNGFSLSVLWPTLIRLLSETLPKKDLGKSSLVMGTTVASGTLITYALSSVYAIFNKFKYAFYTAFFAEVIVSVIWLFLYQKAFDNIKSDRNEEEYIKSDTVISKQTKQQNEKSIFFATLFILCFCAIGINLIKDGLTTWVPCILKEEYSMSDSISILLTLFLPIVAIFGNYIALQTHKKISDYVTHSFVVFLTMGGIICIIIRCLNIKNVILMLIGLILVNLLVSSLNSLLTCIFPMFMRGRINSGLYAGVLNGFCYLGSTISSFGLGFIAEYFGWISVFWSLLTFCVVVAVIWCVYMYIKHRKN